MNWYDVIMWIYTHFFGFDDLIFLAPIIMVIGAVYWVVRSLWQKGRYGGAYKAVRKGSRLNEIIRLLTVCWFLFLVLGLLTGTEYWMHFWVCVIHKENPFTGIWGDPDFAFNYIPIILHFALEGHLDWFISSARHIVPHMALNVALFMPLGLAMPFVYKKASLLKVALTGLIMSFFIEFVQIFIGRGSDIDDLLCNVLGAILGYLVYMLLDKLFPRFTENCKRSADDAYRRMLNTK